MYGPSDIRSLALKGEEVVKQGCPQEKGGLEKVLGSIGLESLSNETSMPPPRKSILNVVTKTSPFSLSLESELFSSSSQLPSYPTRSSLETSNKEYMADDELLRNVKQLARSDGLMTTFAVKHAVESSAILSRSNIFAQTKQRKMQVKRMKKYASRAA